MRPISWLLIVLMSLTQHGHRSNEFDSYAKNQLKLVPDALEPVSTGFRIRREFIRGNRGSVQASLAQTAPRIRLAVDRLTVAAGQTMSVDVLIEGATNLGSFQFNLLYDPELVEVQTIKLGDFLGQTGRQPTPLGPRTDRPGDTAFGAFTLGSPDQRGPDGNGRLATVQLLGKKAGTGSLRLDRPQATDPQGQSIALDGLLTLTPQPSVPQGERGRADAALTPQPSVPPGERGEGTPGRTLIPTVARPPVPSPTPMDVPGMTVGLPLPILLSGAVVAIAIFVIFFRRRRQ